MNKKTITTAVSQWIHILYEEKQYFEVSFITEIRRKGKSEKLYLDFLETKKS